MKGSLGVEIDSNDDNCLAGTWPRWKAFSLVTVCLVLPESDMCEAQGWPKG